MSELETGQVINGRYLVQERLGQGGMGATWAAVEQSTGRRVAIKALSLRSLGDWKALELFEREAQVLSQLDHAGVPAYIEYLRHEPEQGEDFFVLVQELVEGKSLAQLMAEGWRPEPKQVRRLARELLEALVYLHSRTPPVIHRDIKPQNVLLRQDGRAALVDFGAVKNPTRGDQSFASTVVGTYGYMAPEQFRGHAQPSSDLYALAATLVAVLTGQSPENLPHKRLKIDFRGHVDLEPRLADWLDELLEPAPEDRTPSAREALRRLDELDRAPAPQVRSVPEPWAPTPSPSPPPPEKPPTGSRMVVVEDALRLKVDMPAAGWRALKPQNIFLAFFTMFWLSFITVWTGGAALGSPLFALFSIPFWLVGFALLTRLVLAVAGSQELHIDQDTCVVHKRVLGYTYRVQRGNTQDISDVMLTRQSTFNQRKTNVNQLPWVTRLTIGIKNVNIGGHMTEAENRWLSQRLHRHLEEIKQARQWVDHTNESLTDQLSGSGARLPSFEVPEEQREPVEVGRGSFNRKDRR